MRLKKTIILTLFVVYIISAAYMLFFMRSSLWGVLTYGEYFQEYTNFVPFRTVEEFIGYLRTNDGIYGDISAENVFGNFLAFLPTGLFFPAIWKKQRHFVSFLLTASAVIIGVEIMQFITMCGACDIDDYLLNIAGAVTGFVFTKINIIKRLTFFDVSLTKGE